MHSVYLGICILASSFIVAAVDGASIPQDNEILYYENENDGSGNYKFSFETGDNTRREESGKVKNSGLPDQYILVRGYYSYIRPDGVEETVYYTADKDGYRIVPRPEHSQTPILASIPPGVLASLAG